MAILNTVRGLHSTPGVYTKETELKSSSNNSVGITTLGLVGETIKGPAFSPITISNWREYSDTFGETSTELYKGSKYPRYELPYIAQDYLTQSNQLIVTRVLGLSGYNAGKAWLIKSIGGGVGSDMLVGVIRSRGHYVKTYGNPSYSSAPVTSGNIELNVQYVIGRVDQSSTDPLASTDSVTYMGKQYTFGQRFFGGTDKTFTVNGTKLTVYGYCGTNYDYDKFIWDTNKVEIGAASVASANFTCGKVGSWSGTQVTGIPCTPSDFGTFKLTITLESGEKVDYTVSLNPGEKNYIIKVLGSTPDDNDAPIYVEEVYDVALQQLIFKNGVDPVNYISGISLTLEDVGQETSIIPIFKPVNSILTTPAQSLTKSMLNNRYLYTGFDVEGNKIATEYVEEKVTIKTSPYSKVVDTSYNTLGTNDIGKIFVIKEDVDSTGRVTYNYHYVITTTDGVVFEEKLDTNTNKNPDTDGYYSKYIYVENEEIFYSKDSTDVDRVVGDVSDYKEQFRNASTPWIVSEMKGTFTNNEVKKLFRFHSISDGNSANTLFKITIQNINPVSLTFDVVIRAFYDNSGNLESDSNPIILESFPACNLNPASSNYILNKIGSFDNSTPIKSRYVIVEMSENDVRFSIPCGFLGYPVRDLSTSSVKKPALTYNITLNEDVRNRRQYFGMSDLVGIDIDILSYKGRTAYTDGIFTDGFHLDSRISNCNTLVDGENPGVDCTDPNNPVNGMFTWQTVSVDTVGDGGEAPQIVGDDIIGTIYEDPTTRKFTLCMYGGFDGWDIYRSSRSTSDDFKMNRYKGKINPNTGEGEHFSLIKNNELLNLPERGITSDYYAFWAGMLTFNNPDDTPINVFATPGIDYVNDTLLVGEAIEMIEEPAHQRAIYIVTTPDKPFGANDSIASMYTARDVVDNLTESEIDSSYLATYYPWCRYLDPLENKTIFLPPTRDVVRLLALIDNTSYAWFPPAGDQRGRVNCINTRVNLKTNEQDILSSDRINPVKTYAKDGVYIWGQKNLKKSYDNDREPLTRIGVKRMSLRIRELIMRVNRQLVFTPNDPTVKSKFESNCNAVLADVKSNRGIVAYDVKVEDSQEAIEARSLPAAIFIKPLPMLEYIEIDFRIGQNGLEEVN